jgi:hypothetical protein
VVFFTLQQLLCGLRRPLTLQGGDH